MNKIFKVGLIGCGHIAETYFRGQQYFNNFKIIACADIDQKASDKCAKLYNIKSKTVSEILKDNEIEVILNLTIPQSHYSVSKKVLNSGKHVYSEKPLATYFAKGKELVSLAKKNKLYLGNAPDTFLGGGIQKARELIDSDLIGEIKLGNAIFAFPGVESFHPKPESWYKKEGGPVIDMGPYFFTTLVNLLGPAKQVQGRTLTAFKKRIYGVGPKKNKSFKVETPTTYLATIQFHSGAIIQVTLSFDVINHQRNHMELYGTKGSIIVPDPNMFGGSVFISVTEGGKWGEHKTDKMHLGKINITSSSGRSNEAATNANYRSVGLSEMLYSIQKNKKHRCSGDLSLHVLDIIESTMRAANTGTPQKIETNCDRPKKFTEEEVKKILI